MRIDGTTASIASIINRMAPIGGIQRTNQHQIGVNDSHEVGRYQKMKFIDQHPEAKPDPGYSVADSVEVTYSDDADGNRLHDGPPVSGKVTVDNVNNTVTVNQHTDTPQNGDSRRVYKLVGSGLQRVDGPNQTTELPMEDGFFRDRAGDTEILIWGDEMDFGVQIDSSAKNDPGKTGNRTERTIVLAGSGAGGEGTVTVTTQVVDAYKSKMDSYQPKKYVEPGFAWRGDDGWFSWSNLNPSNADGEDDGPLNWWNL